MLKIKNKDKAIYNNKKMKNKEHSQNYPLKYKNLFKGKPKINKENLLM